VSTALHWLSDNVIRVIHAELLADNGGVARHANKNLLGATLARARHLRDRGPEPTLFELAAAYGFGFAKNQCFTDGNKRIALAAMDVFLQLNGYELCAPEPEAVVMVRQIASSEAVERDLAGWVARNSAPIAASEAVSAGA
jgi:death-on-curing protein